MKNLQLFLKNKDRHNAAIFISGSGTNADNILNLRALNNNTSWNPGVIVTDAPKKSKACAIAKKHGIPLIKHDIKEFYLKRGMSRVSIMTDEGRKIREEWTDELRYMIAPFSIDFGILAGFIPLCNITSDFPCLNIHPGDLTVLKNNKRLLVGLHTIPIEIAILNGFRTLRSSVIIAQPYTGKGDDMDSGPILGISEEVKINFNNISLDKLKIIADNRPSIKPAGGYKDLLEEIAEISQEKLKKHGDWVLFPKVIDDFSKNKFACDNYGKLYFKQKHDFFPGNTIIYGKKSVNLI